MTPVNPIRPRDIAWSVLAALDAGCGAAAVLATPVAAAGGCVYTIDGQDLDAASSPDRAIKVANDQTIVLTASGPGPLGQLHIAAWFWPTKIEVPQPAFTTDSTWTGTVDLAAQPVAVQGLYQIEISKDPADCPPSTGWLQISGGNPFLTVPGAIGTGMAVVGSIAVVVALRGALAGRGGTILGAIGGALIGLGALIVAQQAGAVPADARSAAVWTVLPGAVGGTVTRAVGQGLWAGRAECGAARLRIATADFCRRATAAGRAAVARGTTERAPAPSLRRARRRRVTTADERRGATTRRSRRRATGAGVAAPSPPRRRSLRPSRRTGRRRGR